MSHRQSLLLIPGLASNRLMWEPQIQALSDIADCWVAPIPPWDSLVDIAEAILEDAPDKFALAGHSMGGYLCFEILRLAPERVLRVALFGTSAGGEQPDMTQRRLDLIREIEVLGYMEVVRRIIPRFVHPKRRKGGRVFDAMLRQAYEVGKEAFCVHQTAMINRQPYYGVAARTQVPALIMKGQRDIVTRNDVHTEIAGLMPQSQFRQIPDAAHMITLENSDETNNAMREWLTAEPQVLAA